MGILNSGLILAILSPALLCASAFATDPPPRVGAVREQARVEPKPETPAQPEAKAAPTRHTAKKPARRRAVAAQLDDGMTAPIYTPPIYGPRLAPGPPVRLAPAPSPIAPGPVILNGCENGHCMDGSGARYNQVGPTLISPQGRLCSNNGISVSCY
ncbi:MAG: hypothetical protein H7335_22755 [Massilia sp.]|nr:hypothetical protein [Massilia sp.]